MSSIQVATLSGSPAMISQSDVESFRAALRGRLLLPGDESYDDARTVYNAAIDRHPGAIVRCRSTADVIDAVKLADRHELLMAVRGGGHNVAGLGVCDDGLVVDLTEMRGVHLNLGARTVHVQGGATWGDLDRETQAFGLITPGGVVSTTGIGGLTLNGGLGHVRNKFGLSCDNLVSALISPPPSRVEAKRGGVQARRRRLRATSFVGRSRREGHRSVSPSPLIERDVTLSVIRLSDGVHLKACAGAVAQPRPATRRRVPKDDGHGELPVSRPSEFVPAAQKRRTVWYLTPPRCVPRVVFFPPLAPIAACGGRAECDDRRVVFCGRGIQRRARCEAGGPQHRISD